MSTWRTFVPTYALPSFGLAVFVFAAFVSVVYGRYQGWLELWQGAVFNSLLLYINFTVLHEAAHGNLACSHKPLKPLENLCGWISGALLTVPFPIFRQLHLTHHAFTNHPQKDPDMWVAAHRLPSMLMRFCSIIPGYYGFIYQHYRQLPQTKKPKQRQRLSAFVLIYGGLLLWGIFGGWEFVLFLWLIPAMVATSFLAFAFNWLPHHPHESLEKYTNTRVIPGQWLNWVLLGQNYHLIHHLYPRIPFYAYQKTYKTLSPELKQEGIHILGAHHD